MTHVQGARLVNVVARVEFGAYVLPRDEADYNGHRNLDAKVAAEIADAVEHWAGYLSDSEPGDALIAVCGGGSGLAVVVSARCRELRANSSAVEAAARDAVEATEAWRSSDVSVAAVLRRRVSAYMRCGCCV